MAKIIIKNNKKVITVTEGELFNGTHTTHVTTALGAFADKKEIIHDNPSKFTANVINHNFSYNKNIPTEVLERALEKLQVSIDK